MMCFPMSGRIPCGSQQGHGHTVLRWSPGCLQRWWYCVWSWVWWIFPERRSMYPGGQPMALPTRAPGPNVANSGVEDPTAVTQPGSNLFPVLSCVHIFHCWLCFPSCCGFIQARGVPSRNPQEWNSGSFLPPAYALSTHIPTIYSNYIRFRNWE